MSGNFINSAFGTTIAANNSTDNQTKLSEDRYEIYVNNDFVGYKTLFNVSDTLADVDDFLKSQGIEQFKSELNGDHYTITSDDATRVKDALNVYCHNR